MYFVLIDRPKLLVAQLLRNAVEEHVQNLSSFVYQSATSMAQAGQHPPASLLNVPAKHLRFAAALLQDSSDCSLSGGMNVFAGGIRLSSSILKRFTVVIYMVHC